MAYKVLIVEDIADTGKELLQKNGYEIVISSDTSVDPLKRDIADCDAVISKTVFLTQEILKAGKRIKVIGKHGAGVDNVVNVEEATRLGIYVVNTPSANSKSVAEFTIGLIIALSKNLIDLHNAAAEGDFGIIDRMHGIELCQKTLGILGLGRIGSLVAQKAYFGLEMNIMAYDPFILPKDLPGYIRLVDDVNEIILNSDFVTLHLPSIPETIKLIDYSMFEKMKATAFFINCARGNIVNEADLVKALQNKIIAGAALDVYELEPPQQTNPLLSLPNVIHTPHCAAISKEALQRMSYEAAMGVHEVLSGNKPSWAVNSPVRG